MEAYKLWYVSISENSINLSIKSFKINNLNDKPEENHLLKINLFNSITYLPPRTY